MSLAKLEFFRPIKRENNLFKNEGGRGTHESITEITKRSKYLKEDSGT